MFSRFIILILLAGLAPVAWAQTSARGPLTAKELTQGYSDGYVLAKPRADRVATADAEESSEGFRIERKFNRLGGLRLLKLGSGDTPRAAIGRLRATGRYEYVEPDYIRHATATTPNDPDFSQQWSLSNTGANGPGSGVSGADIHATAAWDTIHDAPDVIVAILDTGVDISHVDLAANLWQNPQENADGLGNINDQFGISVYNSVITGNPNDGDGHGTHVAGIIGAVGDNGTLTSGIAWKVQIMGLRFLGSSGQSSGLVSDEVTCIDFAMSPYHVANLINASFGGSPYSSAEYDAIKAAGSAGIIFVAAAGNNSEENDLSPVYPASYLLDNIVSVAASDNRDNGAYFTNYGSGLVDLYAPGYNILSLYIGSGNDATAWLSGTSMAAPHVTGSLALLKEMFPTDTYRQLINRLLSTVDTNSNYTGKAQTGGRLDLANAVTATSNRPFNDNFANRAHLAGTSAVVRSNNAGAGGERGEPSIAGDPGGASLWWDWTAPVAGSVSITTTGSAYATLLAVYTGTSLTSLTPVSSNDTLGMGASSVTFTAQAGTTYEITADGQAGASGLTVLNLSYSNDAFASPITLSGASVSLTASNLNASREKGEPQIAGHAGGHSVWYSWTAPITEQFQVSVFSLDFDPLLAVYTGTSISALTAIAANAGGGIKSTDAVPASTCVCTFNATAGTTYYITVDGSPDNNATNEQFIADTSTAIGAGQFTLSIADSIWQGVTGDSVTCSPTVGSDGTVYVGSNDGHFYAFNPNGSNKWASINLGGSMDTSAACISSDGSTIYVCAGNYIYARNTSDGTPIWQYQLAAACAPTLGADGTIYVKDDTNTLYALNPSSSNLSQALRTKWTLHLTPPSPPPFQGASYAAPVIGADGTIYIGSDDSYFYAINPSTGTSNWTYHADGPINTAAAIDSSGNLYFGTLNGTLYILSSGGGLISSYHAGSSITSSPAIDSNGVVYFGCYDHKLYALNTAAFTGISSFVVTLKWTYVLGGEVRASSPVIDANGVIYVGCYDGNVYAINPNGSLNRTFATGYLVRSSPVISGGSLYVGSEDHKLYAFSIGAIAAVSPWPMYLYNASRIGRTPAVVTVQPQSTIYPLEAGQFDVLSVAATGPGTLTYQWQFNGSAIPGATNTSYTVSASYANVGIYTVIISGAQGSITSAPAEVSLDLQQTPTFTLNPASSVTIASGRTAVFSVAATGVPAFQWYFNNGGTTNAIAGATDPILLISNATSANAGTYTCTAANASGTATSSAGALSVITTATPAYLVALSARANIGTGNNILIGGVTLRGSGTKQLILRGVGPALGSGVGIITNPLLTMEDINGLAIATNTGWGNAPVPGSSPISVNPQVASSTVQLNNIGSTLANGSADSAMLVTAPVSQSADYTMEVSGVAGGTGIGLVEIYNADSGTPTGRINSLSARAFVGTGNSILIGGFSIRGSGSETVLVRGIGPSLGSTALAQPVLGIYDGSGALLFSNTVWGGDATIQNVTVNTAGPPGLNASSQDSVLLLTLPAGPSANYTAQVTGLYGTTGIALVEIYEVP